MDLVIASNNEHKISELKNLLPFSNFKVYSVSEFSTYPAEEIGKTFVENAIIKARHAAAHANMPALADDSGLIVPALNNEPGLFSSRYTSGGDEANRKKLIENISGVAPDKRLAYYYCCLVLLDDVNDPCPIIAEGKWIGEIIPEERGANGFGYDPCFYLPELGKTAAELSSQEKNKLSHRAIAMENLVQQLKCLHYL